MSIEKRQSKRKSLIAASIAGLIAVAGTAIVPSVTFAADENCYGINACKGAGDCGGKASSCAGQNACKGQGFIKLPSGTCAKIQGGSTTAPTE